MASKISLILLIMFIAVLSSCVPQGDVTLIVKALPDVKEFLDKNPNVEIKAVLLSKETIGEIIAEIRESCLALPIKAYWRTEIKEGANQLLVLLDAETQQPVCIVKKAGNYVAIEDKTRNIESNQIITPPKFAVNETAVGIVIQPNETTTTTILSIDVLETVINPADKVVKTVIRNTGNSKIGLLTMFVDLKNGFSCSSGISKELSIGEAMNLVSSHSDINKNCAIYSCSDVEQIRIVTDAYEWFTIDFADVKVKCETESVSGDCSQTSINIEELEVDAKNKQIKAVINNAGKSNIEIKSILVVPSGLQSKDNPVYLCQESLIENGNNPVMLKMGDKLPIIISCEMDSCSQFGGIGLETKCGYSDYIRNIIHATDGVGQACVASDLEVVDNAVDILQQALQVVVRNIGKSPLKIKSLELGTKESQFCGHIINQIVLPGEIKTLKSSICKHKFYEINSCEDADKIKIETENGEFKFIKSSQIRCKSITFFPNETSIEPPFAINETTIGTPSSTKKLSIEDLYDNGAVALKNLGNEQINLSDISFYIDEKYTFCTGIDSIAAGVNSQCVLSAPCKAGSILKVKVEDSVDEYNCR